MWNVYDESEDNADSIHWNESEWMCWNISLTSEYFETKCSAEPEDILVSTSKCIVLRDFHLQQTVESISIHAHAKKHV